MRRSAPGRSGVESVSDDAEIILHTYYNYVQAWAGSVEQRYGSGAAGQQALIVATREIPAVQHLQGGAPCADELTAAYLRGKLTLQAMQGLPVDAYPDLAMTANLWLPVQTYYAIHGAGLAALTALGHPKVNTHHAFCESFSNTLVRYFPPPLGATCGGGPDASSFVYVGVNTTPAAVRAQSNLASPARSQLDVFVGKTLCTTRQRELQQRLSNARKQQVKHRRTYRRLGVGEKQQIAKRLHATTVCDFLYRMRLRANYDDPGMSLAAYDHPALAREHYKALLLLAESVTEALGVVIERKIGRAAKRDLDARVRR